MAQNKFTILITDLEYNFFSIMIQRVLLSLKEVFSNKRVNYVLLVAE
jgi:hypothetical protein